MSFVIPLLRAYAFDVIELVLNYSQLVVVNLYAQEGTGAEGVVDILTVRIFRPSESFRALKTI